MYLFLFPYFGLFYNTASNSNYQYANSFTLEDNR